MDLRLLRYFVTVVEERHMGRAAARLHMTQPPLSRAIKQLEAELGTSLLDRTSAGVSPTAAGVLLYDEARSLLQHADEVLDSVARQVGSSTLRLGTLADSAGQTGADLAAVFREEHPGVRVPLYEADFTDPSAGLRSGRTDVAITRTPFDMSGLRSQRLRTDRVGVVLRSDDRLAAAESVSTTELADRSWFRLPSGTDPVWHAYWSGPPGAGSDGPVVRTVNECLQAVLWNGSVGMTPVHSDLPDGLCVVPLTDVAPSSLVLVWRHDDPNPLIRAFAQVAASVFRPRRRRAT